MYREAWRAAIHGGCKELDTTEQLTCPRIVLLILIEIREKKKKDKLGRETKVKRKAEEINIEIHSPISGVL